MDEREIRMLVKSIIAQEMAPILMGKIVSNETAKRSTYQRFPSEIPQPNARSIQPFGLTSRAPANTPAVIVPVNSDTTHQNVMGHFDEIFSPPIGDGETAIYNQFGQVMYLKNGKITIGSEAASENLVLGQIFKTMMSTLLQSLADHTHAGIGYPPTNKADFLALKASPVDDQAVLSDENFTEKG